MLQIFLLSSVFTFFFFYLIFLFAIEHTNEEKRPERSTNKTTDSFGPFSSSFYCIALTQRTVVLTIYFFFSLWNWNVRERIGASALHLMSEKELSASFVVCHPVGWCSQIFARFTVAWNSTIWSNRCNKCRDSLNAHKNLVNCSHLIVVWFNFNLSH